LPPSASIAACSAPSKDFALHSIRVDAAAALAQDVDACLTTSREQRRLEQGHRILLEKLERALEICGEVASIADLDALGKVRLGQRLDHVASLGEQLEVRVAIAIVGVAVLAEEELGVAGARELVVGLGERADPRRSREGDRMGLNGLRHRNLW
jgi:hypothetical protein